MSYSIGVAEPTSIVVNTFGTGVLPDHELAELIRKHFDMRPSGIIRTLNLRKPLYRQVAAYGHMGRWDISLPWKELDMADSLHDEVFAALAV